MIVNKTVSILGATGLIGQVLVDRLIEQGYTIKVFTRNTEKARKLFHSNALVFDNDAIGVELTGSYAVINLAGENIAGKRWSAKQRKKIIHSRIKSCEIVISAINSMAEKPVVYLQASAIGLYPFSFDASYTEESSPGDSFLSQVTQKWENTITKLDPKVRRVLLRTGVVLSDKGGMLPRIALPIKLFVGGVIGSGKQWISWIHIDDEIDAIIHLLENHAAIGAFNLVSPNSVTMKTFIKTAGTILKRPTFFRVPAFAINLLFGKMGEETILSGQRVLPEKLEKNDFSFRYHKIYDALINLL